MSWATPYIARLQAGETVQFRPRGQSMRPRVESGALCMVAALAEADVLAPGDVVLCRVRGAHYRHLVKAIESQRCLIGNNRGGLNGWIGRAGVYGRLVAVGS
jgi:hypothetical protein